MDEIEELAKKLQGFVVEESDLVKGQVFQVMSYSRCFTIADNLIKEGYRKPKPSEEELNIVKNINDPMVQMGYRCALNDIRNDIVDGYYFKPTAVAEPQQEKEPTMDTHESGCKCKQCNLPTMSEVFGKQKQEKVINVQIKTDSSATCEFIKSKPEKELMPSQCIKEHIGEFGELGCQCPKCNKKKPMLNDEESLTISAINPKKEDNIFYIYSKYDDNTGVQTILWRGNYDKYSPSKCGLDEKEIYEFMCSNYPDLVPRNNLTGMDLQQGMKVIRMVKRICSTFTPQMPSEEDIMKCIYENQFKGGLNLTNEHYVLIFPSQVASAILAKLKEKR